MPKFETPGGDKSLWDKAREFAEGSPVRKDLAARETVKIGDKELKKEDHVYSRTTKGELIEWDIVSWNDYGLILKPSNADSLNLKERLLGGADEHLFEWDCLDMLSTELGE
ncbi:hypothetical protein KJ969_01485 [Patescibacteria group bacterium]|nr:hypothetical protein [Patescibacteria group bacterium]MBU1921890.1 hypothetical protein [Patescibacteria group bacterium]